MREIKKQVLINRDEWDEMFREAKRARSAAEDARECAEDARSIIDAVTDDLEIFGSEISFKREEM